MLADDVHLFCIPVILILEGGIVVEMGFFFSSHGSILFSSSLILMAAVFVSHWTGVSVAPATATVCLMGANLASHRVGDWPPST